MTKKSQDIGYSAAILGRIFRCPVCGHKLLMFGCNNKDCENYNIARMNQYFKDSNDCKKD